MSRRIAGHLGNKVEVITMRDLYALRIELQHERQLHSVLKETVVDWKLTNGELEQRVYSVEDEDNEWKSRCDSQAEYNKYLENELKELAEKVKEERIKLRRLQNNSGTEFDEIPDSELKILVARLTREKYELESESRDYEWRLDQEAKLFYRADENRRAITLDIKKARHSVLEAQEIETKHKLDRAYRKHERESKIPKQTKKIGLKDLEAYNQPQFRRQSIVGAVDSTTGNRRLSIVASNDHKLRRVGVLSNIDSDKRILDPRKGPINKIAAMRTLPKIADQH